MYFLFSSCACLCQEHEQDHRHFELLYDYDKAKFVACQPAKAFATREELFTHLIDKFFAWDDDIRVGGERLRQLIDEYLVDVERDGFKSFDAIANHQSCCTPRVVFDSKVTEWNEVETFAKYDHTDEEKRAHFIDGTMILDCLPLTRKEVEGPRHFLVPRAFYDSWYLSYSSDSEN